MTVPPTGPVAFSDLAAAHHEIRAELDDAVRRSVDSGWYLLGPELERFEEDFARYCEVDHCVGVGSGVAAIELGLRALGVGPGDEVIVPAYTWIASWLGISRIGATPVGVDVDPTTWSIDPTLIEAAIGPRTKAILPVHLRGEPVDAGAIERLAAKHRLVVVEDAAQAHGARVGGRRAGSLGDAAAFSFYPTKNLGALGDGGAVTTDDAEVADRIRLLRNYGTRNRYEIEVAGVNSRLAEIQSAVLATKLPHLDRWNGRRADLAAIYDEALRGAPGLELPEVRPGSEPAWHLYVVSLADRDGVREALRVAGVETLVHYPVLPHLSPAYAELKIPRGTFPVAERLAESVLSLPLYPQLKAETISRVADLVLTAAARSAA
jgi:dTDP-3-amino-3,4,6-trideoxy-alpha-D-glucose transaminase